MQSLSLVLKKFQKLGFKLPREHGLTIILISSVGLGLGLAFQATVDIIGIILSLLFAVFILLSTDSIMSLVKPPHDRIEWVPISSVLVLSLLIIGWRPIMEVFLILGVMGILSVGWMVNSYRTKKVMSLELMLGATSISFLTTYIYVVSTISLSSEILLQILIVNWIFIGIAVIHIQYVETLRGKLTIDVLFYSWLVFLASIIIPVSYQIVGPLIVIPLIEPTIFVLLQTYRKELLKESKRKIKTIGFQLMFREWLAVILLLILYPSIIR